jgi:PEP-CTERM motif
VRTRFFGIALATLVLIASAYGDAIFATGDHPQPGEENILFLTNMSGSAITGHTNHSHTPVTFTLTTDTLSAKSGQSDIDAADGFINDLTITVPGHSFLDLIFNPFKPGANGDLAVTVVTNTGPLVFTYGNMHGDNFLTIMTTRGQTISSVTIDSASGFQDLKQPRISGISGATIVPEPSSMLLPGSGLLGVAMVVRRKSC